MDSLKAVVGVDPVSELLKSSGDGDMMSGLSKLLSGDLKEHYTGLVGSHADELKSSGFAIGDKMAAALLEKYGGKAKEVSGKRTVPDNVSTESKKLMEANIQEPLLHPVLLPFFGGLLTPIMDEDFKAELVRLMIKKKLAESFPCYAPL
eukprot:TRINITY_DN185_c0_g1_i4.p2 TRINITY_DN185_c0_g1~~TRINITY_DN185_c0_g1_i4.p2  ORF type:complete len:149 (-),score=43.66 TRINITY_DN185_c0_g1_i4:359-805(-)